METLSHSLETLLNAQGKERTPFQFLSLAATNQEQINVTLFPMKSNAFYPLYSVQCFIGSDCTEFSFLQSLSVRLKNMTVSRFFDDL